MFKDKDKTEDKNKRVLKNFQGAAVEQGADFNRECLKALGYAGFEIADTELHIPDVGITLDAVTSNWHGLSMAWEFKGSWQGTRPGLTRTDTVKKAIANGYLLSISELAGYFPPMLIMASHQPDNGDGLAMLNAALRDGVILDVVDSRDGKRLKWLFEATEEELKAMLYGRL